MSNHNYPNTSIFQLSSIPLICSLSILIWTFSCFCICASTYSDCYMYICYVLWNLCALPLHYSCYVPFRRALREQCLDYMAEYLTDLSASADTSAGVIIAHLKSCQARLERLVWRVFFLNFTWIINECLCEVCEWRVMYPAMHLMP